MIDKTKNTQEETKEISLEEQLNAARNKYERFVENFHEYQKRSVAQMDQAVDKAIANTYIGLLPILNDLDKAKDSIDSVTDLGSLKEGLKLVSNTLTKSLIPLGLEQMDVVKGQDFNSDKHEAIAVKSVEKELKGKIVGVLEKGYTLNGEIIRYPKVAFGL